MHPTQFTIPMLEAAGYANRISNVDYLNLRKHEFAIINGILYDKFCYVTYTFQVLNGKMPDGPSRHNYSRLILPEALLFIPDDYDDEHGIASSLRYSVDHEVPIHSDYIDMPSKPMGILSLL